MLQIPTYLPQYPDTQERNTVSEEKRDWLTTARAADIMEVTKQHVQHLCRDGAIDCQKHGRDWMVNRLSAEDWKRKKTGRPKKGSN